MCQAFFAFCLSLFPGCEINLGPAAFVCLFLCFSLYMVEAKLTCCSLEVFHDSSAFSVLLSSVALLLFFFVFIFYGAEVNLLPGF